MNLRILNRYRVTRGDSPLSSNDNDLFGFFFIPQIKGPPLQVMAAPFDGSQEWEHVSVSLPTRTPTWEEMCKVKDLFWNEDQVVIQFHPKKKDYVNNHSFCLHLWRDATQEIKTPPSILVGLK